MLPVSTEGVRQGISRHQSARYHSALARWRNADDRIRRESRSIWCRATDRRRLRWMVDEPDLWRVHQLAAFREATLTFPQTLVLRYTQLENRKIRRSPQVATDYAKWFLRPVACGGSRHGQKRDALRRPLHRGRYPRSDTRYCWRRGSAFPRILVQRSRPIGNACRRAMVFAGRWRPRIWPATSKTSRGRF